MELTSFGPGFNAAIFGASGGIGRAFTDHLAALPQVGQVFAVSRSITAPAANKVTPLGYDPADEASIAEAAREISLAGPLHLAIICVGILHDGAEVQPEKTWRSLDPAAMARLYQVNTILPCMIAKHVLPLLDRERKSALAALSARVGSIEDNRLGGWLSYRSSKAALNMAIRTLAIELTRRNHHALFVGLHPGTVDTALSEPFQANVPAGKLFSPAQSTAQMLSVLNHLTPTQSGGVFAYDGTPI